jgi:CRP-like cAMP-binding protein
MIRTQPHLTLPCFSFDPAVFLAHAGLGRRIVELKEEDHFFSQGDPAESVFYLRHGRAKLTVVSQTGKEATITLLGAGDFVGEGALATVPGQRLCSSDLFLKFLLERSMRTQADLIDQLFNSSEKRLARTLLLMAEFGKPGEPETFIPPVT